MDEAGEERDRVSDGVGDGVGCRVAGTRLYLVHACRCCLVTERKQIEGRELESTSPFIFFTLSPPGLTLYQNPNTATRTQTKTLSLSLPPAHTRIQREPRPLLAVRMAAVLLSGRRRVKEDKQRQKAGDELGRKQRQRIENAEKDNNIPQGCGHSIYSAAMITRLSLGNLQQVCLQSVQRSKQHGDFELV